MGAAAGCGLVAQAALCRTGRRLRPKQGRALRLGLAGSVSRRGAAWRATAAPQALLAARHGFKSVGSFNDKSGVLRYGHQVYGGQLAFASRESGLLRPKELDGSANVDAASRRGARSVRQKIVVTNRSSFGNGNSNTRNPRTHTWNGVAH
jgi:hypothetical protein